MLTLDANLFREFIGTTWTLEGRREAGDIKAYATRVTGQTYRLHSDGRVTRDNAGAEAKSEVPKYVLTELRRLVADTQNNATFFDAYVVAIDVDPDYVSIDPEDAAIVKGIRQVFVMDRNRHVHCCELAPSYELHPLYDTMVFHDGVDYPDDYRLQELAEKYERNESDVEYHYVSSFDRYIHRNPGLVHRVGGYAVKYNDFDGEQAGEDSTDYEEVLEFVSDYFRGNHVF